MQANSEQSRLPLTLIIYPTNTDVGGLNKKEPCNTITIKRQHIWYLLCVFTHYEEK